VPFINVDLLQMMLFTAYMNGKYSSATPKNRYWKMIIVLEGLTLSKVVDLNEKFIQNSKDD
jgi:hypothetical protein